MDIEQLNKTPHNQICDLARDRFIEVYNQKFGEADIAVIPVENSTAGRVMEVYNILPESGLSIIGIFCRFEFPFVFVRKKNLSFSTIFPYPMPPKNIGGKSTA